MIPEIHVYDSVVKNDFRKKWMCRFVYFKVVIDLDYYLFIFYCIGLIVDGNGCLTLHFSPSQQPAGKELCYLRAILSGRTNGAWMQIERDWSPLSKTEIGRELTSILDHLSEPLLIEYPDWIGARRSRLWYRLNNSLAWKLLQFRSRNLSWYQGLNQVIHASAVEVRPFSRQWQCVVVCHLDSYCHWIMNATLLIRSRLSFPSPQNGDIFICNF